MKIEEFLKLPIDIDVGNDYSDEFTDDLGNEGFIAEIAFCGPQKLTDEGKKHFERALTFEIDVSDNYAVVSITQM